MLNKFRFLKVSLALVLMVVGVKMLLAEWMKIAFGIGLTSGVKMAYSACRIVTVWEVDCYNRKLLKIVQARKMT